MTSALARYVIVVLCSSCLVPAGKVDGLRRGTPALLRRPVTVSDAIRMTRIEGRGDIALFSPDYRRFVLVFKKGNLESNQVEYSLLLFRADEVFSAPKPKRLVTMSSSSNRPALHNVRWIDNHTVAFLGENPGQTQQVYIINCDTHRIDQLTHHGTNVSAYQIAPNGDMFFTAERKVGSLFHNKVNRLGLIVSNEWLPDLISGQDYRRSSEQQELFKQRRSTNVEILLQDRGITPSSASYPAPELSPDGRYLVVKVKLSGSIPASWREYGDPWIRRDVEEGSMEGGSGWSLQEFELIDTRSGKARILVDAPTGLGNSEILWSPNSKSVVISGTYLPLSVVDSADRKLRCTNRFTVEVDVSTGEISPIESTGGVSLRRWDAATGTLVLQTDLEKDDVGDGRGLVEYQKRKGRWNRVEASDSDQSSKKGIEVSVRDDINTPPRVFVRNRRTGETKLLIDPNPQFQELGFGKVERVLFRATNGQQAEGVLYFPLHYEASVRYPLVIQTHAGDLARFAIDGPYTTAFAAQSLAGQDIAVVQLKDTLGRIGTTDEVPDEASIYEGVIDYLDSRRLVDLGRVGIIAFSRTGLAVQYVLTHSRYKFAAASLADTSDAGYFRYLALLNQSGIGKGDNETINGAVPFGEGLSVWLKNSPGFNLARVNTPIWLEANSPDSLLFEWEWFVGLLRLGKPVELVYLPDGGHVLFKPRDRMISQQGNVDWFRFWLQDYKDPDPAKAEQYKRWGELRKLREVSDRKPST
jgi:dipeptidyl aminopeptidase/acylaminoacyl peptidase